MNLAQLNEMFEYVDGELIRRKTISYNAKAGQVAGTEDKSTGYLKVNFDGKVRLVHRLIWAIVHGEEPKGMIDHIDGDRTNNRLENLRCCDNRTNMQNLKGARKDSKTGVLGVSLCNATGKYVGRIRAPSGKYLSVGRFATPEQASDAYLAAKRQIHAGCTM